MSLVETRRLPKHVILACNYDRNGEIGSDLLETTGLSRKLSLDSDECAKETTKNILGTNNENGGSSCPVS